MNAEKLKQMQEQVRIGGKVSSSAVSYLPHNRLTSHRRTSKVAYRFSMLPLIRKINCGGLKRPQLPQFVV